MDLLEFDEASANLSQFIDQTLQDALPADDASLASLDHALNALSFSLQAAQTETAAHVESTMHDIVRSIPRLSFDLQLMREHALLLRFTLDSIRKPASGNNAFMLDPQTSAILDKLATLDQVKNRMQAARDVLREAESWSSLDAEVTGYIQDATFNKAADRLQEASKSMVVFNNTVELEDRRALMISLQNSLEAALSASLLKAIQAKDVKGCKTYFDLFCQIQRETEYRNYYYGSRRSALLKRWQTTPLIDISTTSTSQAQSEDDGIATEPLKFTDFLTEFYRDLLQILEQERMYLASIFPDPLTTLSRFIQSTIDSLIPSFHTRLSECADVYGPKMLPILIEAYGITVDFALKVDRLLSTLVDNSMDIVVNGGDNVSPIEKSTPKTPGSVTSDSNSKRRMSKRYSISGLNSKRSSQNLGNHRNSLSAISPSASSVSSSYFPVATPSSSSEDTARGWEVALFEPFLDYQVEYAALEKSYLSQQAIEQFNTSAATKRDSRLRASATSDWKLSNVLPQFVFRLKQCEDALTRCIHLTHGFGLIDYLTATDDVLSTFITDQIVQVKSYKNHLSSTNEDQSLDLEGLDYSAEDWAVFQFGLHLLGICQQVSARLSAHETTTRGQLAEITHIIFGGRMTLQSSPDHAMDGRTQSTRVKETTTGALVLLKQSALNSAELESLVERLSPSYKGTLRPASLFNSSEAGLTEFAKASQSLLHDTIIGPLNASLANYPSLPVWTSTGDGRSDISSAFDVNIPTFSLSPTEVMTRLGEGLFNLPRLFEVYADDDALAYSIHTLPFIEHVQPDLLINSTNTNHSHSHSMLSPPISTKRASSLIDADHPHTARKEDAPAQPLSTEIIISTWLTSLTTAVLRHLTDHVLPRFRVLSSRGASQLASDLSHLSNVAKALDVESEGLEKWRECLEMSDAEGKRAILDSAAADDILKRVAAIRHWQ